MKNIILMKFREFKIVFFGLILCVALLTIRLKATNSFFFLFLGWNLILAMIPYGISVTLLAQKKLYSKWWFRIPIIMLWILFLPNAPYLITDLQHLRVTPQATLWYDILLLFSFIIYALILMIFSVRHMETLLPKKWGETKRFFSIASIFLLCGFGIYLGRYLRWNSWDVIQNPSDLLDQIWMQITQPKKHIRTWLVTSIYGVLLSSIYLGARQKFNKR